MLDIRRLRHEHDAVREALAKRDPDLPAAIDAVLAKDADRRDALGLVNDLKAQRNEASKKIGELKRAGEDTDELVARTKAVGDKIAELDDIVRQADREIRSALLAIPNTPLDAVPLGGEEANRVLCEWGEPAEFAFEPLPHWDIGERLGILDPLAGARVSGSGFPVLRGVGARLQRGLINFFLDVHTLEHGYIEVRVPYLVTQESMIGTGQLPKFADESYHTERDDLWLIPTAEVAVTNLHRDELLTRDDLPVRYTAYSPCFRREAGAAGKDTAGLYRVHQRLGAGKDRLKHACHHEQEDGQPAHAVRQHGVDAIDFGAKPGEVCIGLGHGPVWNFRMLVRTPTQLDMQAEAAGDVGHH